MLIKICGDALLERSALLEAQSAQGNKKLRDYVKHTIILNGLLIIPLPEYQYSHPL